MLELSILLALGSSRDTEASFNSSGTRYCRSLHTLDARSVLTQNHKTRICKLTNLKGFSEFFEIVEHLQMYFALLKRRHSKTQDCVLNEHLLLTSRTWSSTADGSVLRAIYESGRGCCFCSSLCCFVVLFGWKRRCKQTNHTR